jgi:preprotein translocase subunit YajC
MHPLLHILAQATATTLASTSTTKAGSTKSSSSYLTLLVIVAAFVLIYAFFIRPRQQKLRQQQTVARSLAVGDEVMSAGGIFGTVVALDSDAVEVQVAPGVVMTFLRRAISPSNRPGAASAPPADDGWPPAAADRSDPGEGGSAATDHPGS